MQVFLTKHRITEACNFWHIPKLKLLQKKKRKKKKENIGHERNYIKRYEAADYNSE